MDVSVDYVPVATSGDDAVMVLPGKHVARARFEDYHDFEQAFEAPAQSEEPIRVTGKMNKRIYKGFLKIVTEPADGVQIFLDDKLVGTTPLKEPIALETRRYLVRFEKPGYDRWIRYVTIERERTADLAATLEPASK